MAQAVKIDDDAVSARLPSALPHWTFAEGRLHRIYRTHDWKSALTIVGAIGWLAEAAWHHPDLSISFGRVVVSLSTHDAGGVTERDFALAARIEALVAWRPDPAGPFETPPVSSVLADA
jgi:4a-hydroxytetrahydrobiopterin dehydratase